MRRPAPRRAALLLAAALAAGLAPAGPASAAAAVERIAGPSRIATAVRIAQTSHPDGAEAVVLARADAYADALAGGPLAASLDAPVLLTGSGDLDGVAADEITRLGAARVVLLGGPAALGEAVETALHLRGVHEIERVAGPNRFATAAAIAVRVGGTGAYLAEGANADPARGWPDALAVSPLAAFERRPVLLTAGGALPADTARALEELGTTDLTVVGGTAAVPAAVEAEAAALVDRVDRVAGASRYETAAALLARAEAAGMTTTTAWVASGAGWPDALVAGPAAARDGVLVLTDPAGLERAAPTAAWLAERATALERIRLVGGTGSVSTAVEDGLHGLGGPASPPPASPEPEPEPEAEPVPAPPPAGADDGDGGAPAPRVPAEAVRWSDPATWGGRVPTAGQDVTIPADLAVLLDVSPPALGHLVIDGELYVDEADLVLQARSVMVHGLLSAGAADRPFAHRFELVLDGRPGDDVMGMGAGALGVMGGQLELHGRPTARTWTRLAATAGAAATSITLTDPVDWRPGDRIVIAATDLTGEHVEERTVRAVAGGTRVELDAPLQHVHWGAVETHGGREVAQRAEVGLLTHDIVVRGADDARETGFGGHVMVHAGSTARMSGIEVRDMGQRGVLGRYPVHFHLMGSAPASYLRDSSVHHSANRCVTLHGTLDALISGVVAHDAVGHCFFFEDAVETGNRLVGNLGLTTRAPDDDARLLDSDRTPATFWLSNPGNHLTGNAAAGSDGSGFWYDLPEHPTGKFAESSVAPREVPMGDFDDNSAHSNRSTGWKTGNGLFIDEYEGPEAAVTDFTAWKNGGFGVWAERVRVTGAVLAENGTSFLGRRATLADSVVVGQTANAGERPWSMLGAGLYVDASHLEDVTFSSFASAEGRGSVRAVGVHTSHTRSPSTVTGLRFEAARGFGLDAANDAGLPRSIFVADLDGSLSGAPGVVTADHPLLVDPSCTALPEGLRRCAADVRNATLKIEDRTEAGDAELQPAAATRDDGAAAALLDAHGTGVETGVRLDRRYRVSLPAPAPARTRVILAGNGPGWVDVAIPWTADTAFAYRPWALDRPMALAPSAGALTDETPLHLDVVADVLHVRMRVDAETTWAQMDLCRTVGCS